MDFKNKVVLVIGGGTGIGAATAIAFANQGADVVIVGRREAKLQEVAALCNKAEKRITIIKADISKDEEAATAVTQTIEQFGRLDILINNAGVLRFGNVIDGTVMNDYDVIMNTNIRSLVYITTLAAQHLIKTKGNIVNVSSITGHTTPKPHMSVHYAMSKAALNMFTKGAAYEFAAHGVRVNAISPGPTRTEMFTQAVSDLSLTGNEEAGVPLNRVSDPEEMADLIIFLASDKAKGITGSNYISDNGFLLVQ